jgi:hypothetical protein
MFSYVGKIRNVVPKTSYTLTLLVDKVKTPNVVTTSFQSSIVDWSEGGFVNGKFATDLLRIDEQKALQKELQDFVDESSKWMYDKMTQQGRLPSSSDLQRYSKNKAELETKVRSGTAEIELYRQKLLNSILPSNFVNRLQVLISR